MVEAALWEVFLFRKSGIGLTEMLNLNLDHAEWSLGHYFKIVLDKKKLLRTQNGEELWSTGCDCTEWTERWVISYPAGHPLCRPLVLGQNPRFLCHLLNFTSKTTGKLYAGRFLQQHAPLFGLCKLQVPLHPQTYPFPYDFRGTLKHRLWLHRADQ